MKKILLIFILTFSLASVCGQNLLSVVAKDESDAYSNTLLIAPACDQKYMETYKKLDSAGIENGIFTFNLKSIEDHFPRPYKFGIIIKKNQSYINSEIFYLNKTDQNIVFNAKNGVINFSKDNLLYDDISNFNEFFKSIHEEKNSLNRQYYLLIKQSIKNEDSIKLLKESFAKIMDKEDHLYKDYAKKNPGSYILFWNLVFKANTYKPIYEDTFKNFDRIITGSAVGNIFYNHLMSLKYFEKGKTFPQLNIKGKNVALNLGKKYTLVDFWFSYCKPCLEEFPKYKALYDSYNKSGFEYIGISSDRTQDIDHWKKIINENKLQWQNILDENGAETDKFEIKKFPTNFLLDSEGKIITKDISSKELEVFLKNKF